MRDGRQTPAARQLREDVRSTTSREDRRKIVESAHPVGKDMKPLAAEQLRASTRRR